MWMGDGGGRRRKRRTLAVRTIWSQAIKLIRVFTHHSPEQTRMRTLSALRTGLIALTALAGALFGPAAYADSGGISFSVIKAGIVIGGSAGSGTPPLYRRPHPPPDGGG